MKKSNLVTRSLSSLYTLVLVSALCPYGICNILMDVPISNNCFTSVLVHYVIQYLIFIHYSSLSCSYMPTFTIQKEVIKVVSQLNDLHH